ncbi:MAG: flagellin [Proteobacteria bacterium]|nr:flagellin [Pseudomonadota bacterium]
MAIVVNSNVPSVHAGRALAANRLDLEKAMERLSSGKRLNSSRDDAAGMSVVTRMTSQIQGLNMAVRNANDGISMANTYDAAAEEVGNVLSRMRELAVQMTSGTYKDTDRTNANEEFSALATEVDRIANNTRFNSVVVADGTAGTSGAVTIQVDESSNASTSNITLTFASLKGSDLVSGFGSQVVSSSSGAGSAIGKIDTALETLNTNRAKVGSVVNRIEHTVAVLMNTVQRTEESRSRIQDTDYAAESANLARANVLAQAGTAMLAQANQSPQYVLQLLKG